MIFKTITKDVLYCGINDFDRVIFDELIPLDDGTTYNSYLIKGSEKIALIDTMYPKFTEEYLKSFDENEITKIDYIIANHGEQDHTGSIPALLEKFPMAKVVTNNLVAGNIKEMLFVPAERIEVIANGTELSLGDKTLKFIIAPGVHWPDTMFTYLKEENIIFTCDFLGSHYTFEEVFAKPSDKLTRSIKKYYAEIMMPFRTLCKKYTKQLRELNPTYICPSHGPIYDSANVDYILSLYEDWTADVGKNLVVLPYVSMYGSVEEMATYLEKKLSAGGVDVLKYDIIRGNLGDLAIALVDATTLVMGVSMVLAGPHPAAVNIAYLAGVLKPKFKYASLIGSFGWGGKLFDKIIECIEPLKPTLLDPVQAKGKPKSEDFEKLDKLAEEIIAKHTELGLI
jgi:flavorubredoxin